MDCAVFRTHLGTMRCNVFATDASTRTTARNRAQTVLLGLRLRSASARKRQETGKEKQAGALDSLKRVGNTAARKARGADTRKRPTFEQQVKALDLLKSMMSGTAIAARLNVDSDDDAADSSAGDTGQCTQPVLFPRPPPYMDVARQFGDLEEIAERCSMTGVSYHLRKAKLAWMSEVGSKKTKQTCMADFM